MVIFREEFKFTLAEVKYNWQSLLRPVADELKRTGIYVREP